FIHSSNASSYFSANLFLGHRQRLSQPKEERGCGNLRRNPKYNQRSDRVIVKPSHRRTAGKPKHAINSIQRAESGAALVHRNDLRDPRPQQSVLRADARCPANDANVCSNRAAEKSERQREQRNQNPGHYYRDPDTVEPLSESQSGQAP